MQFLLKILSEFWFWLEQKEVSKLWKVSQEEVAVPHVPAFKQEVKMNY